MASVSIILPQSKRARYPCMCVELHLRLDLGDTGSHLKAARSDSSQFLAQVHLQIPFHNKNPGMLTDLLTRMLTGMLAGVNSKGLNTSSSTMWVYYITQWWKASNDSHFVNLFLHHRKFVRVLISCLVSSSWPLCPSRGHGEGHMWPKASEPVSI